ncbi:hypothetical protein [Natrarchaeobaculum sulfurireducens]|uniref:Uncharacterized protein n=1 Tax=Natrarchaeobaculum sulfurireducens TaxID=2044521 RepID=A0A346PKU2_9EURY|nr:hypothetical protein [Natrarchaeobaculum sulfurireducens]AXR80137.1 hypothetical protein AArcMg_0105 [Natrarchaeobaculum sulfurireducens]
MVRSETDPTDGGRSSLWPLAVGLAFVLLGSSLLVRSPAAVEPSLAAVGLATLAVVAALLFARRTGTAGSGHDDDDTVEDEDSSVWDAIPSWQYEGRHVESGGLARSEQEQALQDIQKQADELSNDPPEK